MSFKEISKINCQIFNKLKRCIMNHYDKILEDNSTESRILADILTKMDENIEWQVISSYLFTILRMMY